MCVYGPNPVTDVVVLKEVVDIDSVVVKLAIDYFP